jgi:predicted amidohydrolase
VTLLRRLVTLPQRLAGDRGRRWREGGGPVVIRDSMVVALISDVFFSSDGRDRLRLRLGEARSLGADLAVLPELPLDPWFPASDQPRDEDAEPPDGPRQRALSDAAREAGIGVVGGAIVADPATGTRRSTAFVHDASGRLLSRYAKLHLPEEPGFWETSHYEPGDQPPRAVDGFPLTVGVQLCSDINRPEGCHLLGAQGVEAILAPRATEAATWPRWHIVLIANALTSTAYVLSVNRPKPEFGVPIGGASIAVAPDGEVLLETTEPVAVVRLERGAISRARAGYPGYLPVRAQLYADAWGQIARRDG